MATCPDELAPVFSGLEARRDPLSEHEVAKAIKKAIRARYPDGAELPPPFLAEWLAFDFTPAHPHRPTKQGTFFGPMFVGHRKDGTDDEYPDVKLVTAEMLSYWGTRADEASHPLLRARYADLVWDLSRLVTGKAAKVEFARTAIDANTEIVTAGLADHRTEASRKLERALSLALRIKDKTRQAAAVEAILAHERQMTQEGARGWTHAFDALVENKKVKLTPAQEQEIIQRLARLLEEAVAIRADSGYPRDHFVAKDVAGRLARYYRARNDKISMSRVLRTCALAVAKASEQTSAIAACAWLRDMYDLLTQFGEHAPAAQLAVLMRERGRGVAAEMKPVCHTMRVTKDELSAYLEGMLAGSEEDSLMRIICHFVPDPKAVAEQVAELAEVAPLLAMLTEKVVDKDGREIAQVGSVDEDLDGRVVQLLAQNMVFVSGFLHVALAEWVRRHGITADRLTGRVMACGLWEDDRRPILLRGMKAHLDGDYLVSVHLLIPQIECALRHLVASSRQSVYRPNRQTGGLDLKLLAEVLRDPMIATLLTEPVAKYLIVLLTDPRGWNLRNNICHGLIVSREGDPTRSDRLIHVLLLLSLLRTEEQVRFEHTQKTAYALWQARGCPAGDDWTDWFAAEKQLAAAAAKDPDVPRQDATPGGTDNAS